MPPELQRVLFGLKKNEPAMVETSQGFVVAVPAEIAVADPHADKAGFDKLRSELSQNIASDYAGVFQEAVRLRANPNINRTNFDRIVQPQQ
jgi:peptidyl-prolyl cis-trans isomerase D